MYKMQNFENAKVAAKVMCTMRKSKKGKVVIFNIFHNMHIHMNFDYKYNVIKCHEEKCVV